MHCSVPVFTKAYVDISLEVPDQYLRDLRLTSFNGYDQRRLSLLVLLVHFLARVLFIKFILVIMLDIVE